MYKFLFPLLFLFTFLIVDVACNSAQPDRNNTGPYQNLSTDGPEEQQGEQSNEFSPDAQNMPNANEDLPDQNIEQTTPDPNQNTDSVEPAQVPRAMQTTIPETLAPEATDEGKLSIKQHASEAPIRRLPFKGFRERWNAISDAQMNNLYIYELEEIPSNTGTAYRTKLTQQMELRIEVDEDSFISQLELIADRTQGTETNTMLISWSQMINILHPNIEIHDVDDLFYKMGVGPNGDISKVKSNAFDYHELHYEVILNEDSVIFKAAY